MSEDLLVNLYNTKLCLVTASIGNIIYLNSTANKALNDFLEIS